jgi:phosphohistidine phosphatase SixA
VEVYLIRHAVAEVRDPLQWPDDTKRPLTSEGADRFRRAAAGLAALVPEVGVMLSSPWKRSWETAQILQEAAGWPKPEKCEALEGDRSPRGIPPALRQYAQAESIALVGHEPQMHMLASYLLTGDAARLLIEFKKGGAAAFRLDNALRPGTATLLWSHPPRVLRRLA